MARTPDGTVQQERSDTALFGHIAYKLEGIRTKDLGDWATGAKIEVGADALRNAPRHADRLEHLARPREAIRPWLVPDWRALDFFLAAVELRLASAAPAQLEQLEGIKGVLELWSVRRELLVIALVAFERRSDRDSLEARLGDFGSIVSWRELDEHRPKAMARTMRTLAQDAACREQLAAPSLESDCR